MKASKECEFRERWSTSLMGRSECITQEARRTDRQWIKGVRIARDRFG
jgi:hypothetical protein